MNAALTLTPDALKAIAAEVAALIARERPNEPEPWIDAIAAAAHLSCDRRRIYDLKNQQRVPYVLDGRRLLFRRSDLDRFLESGAAAL
jgi:excisionase family DNA binding protein